jgi:glycerophosphoryl diester phosphodiesterase
VALQVPETFNGLTVVSPDFIADAHANNLAVHVWTVNEAADMRRLLRWGVDGIMTDRPTLLERVLAKFKGKKPNRNR